MTQATKLKCVTCRTAIDLRPQNTYFPFCSSRCKQVDLGRWLNEDYRMTLTQTSEDWSQPNMMNSSTDEED